MGGYLGDPFDSDAGAVADALAERDPTGVWRRSGQLIELSGDLGALGAQLGQRFGHEVTVP